MRSARQRTPRVRDRHEDDSLRYIRETLTELERDFGREALLLFCGHGIFSVDDPSKIGDAVERLNDTAELQQQRQALYDEIWTSLPEDKRLLLARHDDLSLKELTESNHTAYLLGIAVGRRLGPMALTLGVRSRKAVA